MSVYIRYAGTIYFFFIPPLAYFISSILFLNGDSLGSWEIPCTRMTVSSIYAFSLESDM